MEKFKISLTLPGHIDYIPVLTSTTNSFAKKCGFEGSQVNLISLALEEAYTHTLEMGYKGIKDEIDITLSLISTGIKIKIISHGLPLQSDQLPKYAPKKTLDKQDANGLSFFLVKKLMDKVSFFVSDSGQRKITMIKHRSHSKTTVLDEKKEAFLDAVIPIKTQHEQNSHHIRLAEPDDAESIARTAFQSHGSVIFHEDIYYPERVRELIQSKEMVSVVAVTDENILLGHGALVSKGQDSLVEELTYGFVNPEFRSRGVISDIALCLLENARNRGIFAIQAMAVTSHIHSQKAILKYGFSETALLLATSAAASNWKKSEDKTLDRIGNLVLVKYLQDIKENTLFIPLQHERIIKEIYSRSGRKIQIEKGEDSPVIVPKESTLLNELDLIEGWAFICILSYGKDIRERIKKIVNEAISQNLPAIQLLLPLHDPTTPFFTDIFETTGFFFAGVGPGDDAKEYLVLQYINWEDKGYDSVHVMDGMGENIKNYVKACDENAKKHWVS